MALAITEAYESGDGELGKDSKDVYRATVTGLPGDGADDPFTVTIFAAQRFSLISPQGNIPQHARPPRDRAMHMAQPGKFQMQTFFPAAQTASFRSAETAPPMSVWPTFSMGKPNLALPVVMSIAEATPFMALSAVTIVLLSY